MTFHRAIDAAVAGGDGRLAATARLNLARLLRGEGDGVAAASLLQQNLRWYEHAGGGEGALLNRCLLYADTGDRPALEQVLAESSTDEEHNEVRIHAMDALAGLAAERGDTDDARALLAEADALLRTVAHVMDSSDRIDRTHTLELLSG